MQCFGRFSPIRAGGRSLAALSLGSMLPGYDEGTIFKLTDKLTREKEIPMSEQEKAVMVDCKRGSQKGEASGSVAGLLAGLAAFRGNVGLSQPRSMVVVMGCVLLGGQVGNMYSRKICMQQFLELENSQVSHVMRHFMLHSPQRERFVKRYDLKSDRSN